MSERGKVAIIGSGLIGRSWAIIFSSTQYRVQLYDSNAESLSSAIKLIRQTMEELEQKGVKRSQLSIDQRMACISIAGSLADCINGAWHIQECVFDSLPLKQGLHKEIDQLLGAENRDVAICSSTSVHLPSLVFSEVQQNKRQCLVAHPINPPYLVPLVELIPTKETRRDITLRVRFLMDEVGMKPVELRKEVPGFALNRLQYAVFQEAFRLIHDGVMSPDDVDTVVSDGLGPRYAFMGPWMTAHLNANGMADYFEKYGEGIYNVTLTCQPLMPLQGEAAQQVIDLMTHEVPLDKLAQKRAWRDQCLVELAKVKQQLGNGV